MLELLLDSHTLVWVLEGGGRLRPSTLAAIFSSGNRVFISAASVWEIAIKVASGRLQVADNPVTFVQNSGFVELPINFRYAELAASLPLHHRDPFDRMLIAQAQVEGLTLVTNDSRIAMYNVPTLDAR